MNGPDQYAMDDSLMDELGGAMDDFDSKKLQPVVTITVAVDKGQQKDDEPEDPSMPTDEEMKELEQALG